MPNTVFEPIDHTSVVDSIVEQIETLILNGILRDGARLPSERDLAEQMGVSRPKVREALKYLEDSDLIQVRHGEGTFVAPLIGSAMSPALIDLYSRHQNAFLDYLEFRIEQESFASGLAATRATKSDKEILAKIMEQMEAAHSANDMKASEDADIRFHSAIIDASHNSLLVHTMSSIYALTRQNLFLQPIILAFNRWHRGSVACPASRNIRSNQLRRFRARSHCGARPHCLCSTLICRRTIKRQKGSDFNPAPRSYVKFDDRVAGICFEAGWPHTGVVARFMIGLIPE